MTSESLTTRIVPPARFKSTGPLRLLERNFLVYRRLWAIVLSGFFEPVFYLFSIGIGIGALVGDITAPDGRVISYAAFVAPAFLAASAMNGPVFESFNIFFKLKYAKTYDAMLASPLSPMDVAVGEISWTLVRSGLYSAGFIIVMYIMGLMLSPFAILAFPATLLIGLAFGSVGMAATTFMRSWQDFDLITLVTMPMFLFSATFYPLEVYPEWLQVVARFSPLYQATDLLRSLTLGYIDASLIVHVFYLVVMAAIGLAISRRRIVSLLLN
jgi:lipooligosaccharide transport system permease protein